MVSQCVTNIARTEGMTMDPAFPSKAIDPQKAESRRQKYFVNRKKVVTVKCRACGKAQPLSVDSLKEQRHTLKLQCSCSRVFEIDLEFRRDYRTKSRISGSFRALSTPRARARQCIIADHSDGGLLLAITDEVPIKENDRLIVSYLPDIDATQEIERIISVRHYQHGKRIGGAFLETMTQDRSASALH